MSVIYSLSNFSCFTITKFIEQPQQDENTSAEKLETLESSYVPVTGEVNRIGKATTAKEENSTSGNDGTDFKPEFSTEEHERIRSDSQHWDLTGSDGDWNNNGGKAGGFASIPLVELEDGQESSNETYSGIDETTDDVEVGEEDDETTSSDVSDLMKDDSDASSSTPHPVNKSTDEIESAILVNPTSEATVTENSTDTGNGNHSLSSEIVEQIISTTPIPESSVGVPLYHVEHVELPTPPTYHKPDEVLSGMEKDAYNVSQTGSTNKTEEAAGPKESNSETNKGATIDEDKFSATLTKASCHAPTTEKGLEQVSSTTTTASTTSLPPSSSYGGGGGGSEEIIINDSDNELRREMEILLDGLKKVYLNLVGVVQDYQELNDTITNKHEKGLDGKEHLLEDSKSHRISPREFRHIRCVMQDDGHQSELCFILRAYVKKLLLNLGTDIHLYHDTIPMYYLPSSATKPFYSVANVLLHHGVMDELALPLLFRGLAPESDWIKLVRSPTLNLSPTTGSGADNQKESIISERIASEILHHKSQYLHPFHLHKVYSDLTMRNQFCKHYLLRIYQM